MTTGTEPTLPTEECGRLSPQGHPCELPQGHGGLCDYEDARADWEKERDPSPWCSGGHMTEAFCTCGEIDSHD